MTTESFGQSRYGFGETTGAKTAERLGGAARLWVQTASERKNRANDFNLDALKTAMAEHIKLQAGMIDREHYVDHIGKAAQHFEGGTQFGFQSGNHNVMGTLKTEPVTLGEPMPEPHKPKEDIIDAEWEEVHPQPDKPKPLELTHTIVDPPHSPEPPKGEQTMTTDEPPQNGNLHPEQFGPQGGKRKRATPLKYNPLLDKNGKHYGDAIVSHPEGWVKPEGCLHESLGKACVGSSCGMKKPKSITPNTNTDDGV